MILRPTIKFVIFPWKANRHGRCNIYLQFILRRRVGRIALQKYVLPRDWVDEGGKFVRQKGRNADPNALQLNIFLANTLQQAEGILLDFENRGEQITFETFKKEFVGANQKDILFQDYFLEFIEQKKEQGLADRTIETYFRIVKKFSDYRPSIYLRQITPDFLKELEHYLRYDRGNSDNTVWTFFKNIRAIILAAIEAGLIRENPFEEFIYRYVNKGVEALRFDEVESLWKVYKHPEVSEKLKRVLRPFLFSCYTGLDHKDISSLDYREIHKNGGSYVISKKRGKTDIAYIVSIPKEALELISPSESAGKVFSYIATIQVHNRYLKEIAKLAGVHKNLTTHIGRHTFGTLSLNLGIPQEVVQRMMGHTNSDMTKHYAKVREQYIVKEMLKWNK